MKTIILLIISNIFMTIAWYGHLKHKDSALFKVTIVKWLNSFRYFTFFRNNSSI
jgi:hypothetical protein